MGPGRADEPAGAVLSTLLGSGRRLLAAGSTLIASGPAGQLAALADLGLTPPLQALARRCEQLSGIPVTLHVSLRYADGVASTRLPPDVELAVYRVIQEALTNIRRHSTATRVVVTVIEDDAAVVAEISDNGQGFDADRAAGFGLSGMLERAEIAHGALEVSPTGLDGRGTTVRLVVPARHR